MYLRGEATLPAGYLPSSYMGFAGLAPEEVMHPCREGGANLYRSSGEPIWLVTTTYIGQSAYLYRFTRRPI